LSRKPFFQAAPRLRDEKVSLLLKRLARRAGLEEAAVPAVAALGLLYGDSAQRMEARLLWAAWCRDRGQINHAIRQMNKALHDAGPDVEDSELAGVHIMKGTLLGRRGDTEAAPTRSQRHWTSPSLATTQPAKFATRSPNASVRWAGGETPSPASLADKAPTSTRRRTPARLLAHGCTCRRQITDRPTSGEAHFGWVVRSGQAASNLALSLATSACSRAGSKGRPKFEKLAVSSTRPFPSKTASW
jgi:hypothetical protein